MVLGRWISTEQVWGTGARLWAQEVCQATCWREPQDAPWSPPSPPSRGLPRQRRPGSPTRPTQAPDSWLSPDPSHTESQTGWGIW